jgi:hypothetical protein
MNSFSIINKKCLMMSEEQILKDWDQDTDYADI